jgi:NADH-quinone oxidoreductase subunit F
MLDDKDRIFRNLYGLEDWGLEGAHRRGAYGILVEVAESS